MSFRNQLQLSAALGATIAALSATAGHAQEAAASPQATDSAESALADIVVTAERRSAKVQDIPIAMTAITGDTLHDKAVYRLSDLQFAAPSLSVTGAGLTQWVNIRGIGLANGSPSLSNGVATYIDGLFQAPIVGTNSFFDIADVQVLRGPQGTFVGAASTGGAILINSTNPELGEVNGYLGIGYGSYSNISGQGAVNLPLGNTIAFRGAFSFSKRDSYYTDRGKFNNDAGKLNEFGGRFSLLWEPSDSFRALAKVQVNNRDTGGYAYRPIVTTKYAVGLVGGIRDLNYDAPTANDEHADAYGLELRWKTEGGITIRSQSGYQIKKVDNLYDHDATSLTTAPTTAQTREQHITEKLLTQELNIISPTGGRLNWVLGAYYQRSDITAVNFDNRVGNVYNYSNIPSVKTTTGYFGQIGYFVVPSIEIQLGLRYSHFSSVGPAAAEARVNVGLPFPPFNTVGLKVADISGHHVDGRLTGRFGVNWKLDSDNLIYAFVARGYKPGGFNGTVLNSNPAVVLEFAPETVIDYELGWKSTFMDGRARTSIGAFYYDYTGYQIPVFNTANGRNNDVFNLADTKVQGIEFEGEFKFGSLKINGGIAYVDSKLSSLTLVNTRLLEAAKGTLNNLGPQCATGQTVGCTDYTPYLQTNTGGVNLYSPKLTYNIGAEVDLEMGSGKLTPRVNWGYVSSQFTNLFYNPVTDKLAARGLLSAQLTYATDNWSVQVFGTNLTDKEYVSGQYNNFANEFYGAPREYGVRLDYKF